MTARRLDRGGGEPLWRQLRADLSARVEAGEFGDRFPGELALAAEYRVSRHTVRQALRDLRETGRVVAERGRRPRVVPTPTIRQPIGIRYSLFASVEAAGSQQRSVVCDRGTRTDPAVAERLGLDLSTPLFHLERLRLAGDEPLAIDRVWLPADLAAPLTQADFGHTALYTELDRLAGVRIDDGHEEVRTVLPTAAERARLRCPAEVAAFVIDRLGHAGGRPVEWRRTLVRGDRFALTVRFSGPDDHPSPTSGDGP